jgi:hypothetical protein
MEAIKNFWPEDTENEMYLDGSFCVSLTLADLIEKAKEKWPGIELDGIDIRAEYIHTRCITYDLYDSGDWTTFIVLRKN